MSQSLKGRSLVSLAHLSPDELQLILDTAAKVKKHPEEYATRLTGKTLAMIFQKPSLRTRVSFEAGMTQMGGHAIYLGPSDISIGKRETTEDIAIVLSRMCNMIMARTFGHDIVEDLAKHSTVPVINGLSDFSHPCQILADLQTIAERRGKLKGLKFTYLGDGNNVAHSILFGGALAGMHVNIVTPKDFEPNADVVRKAADIAAMTGGSARTTHSVEDGAKGADVLYTDVWASMGQEADAQRRHAHFVPYQLNMNVLKMANPDCVVLHCLPAHYGDEITYDISRTKNAAIFDEAENRLHAQKALMLLLAGAA
ncbi:MAG: ornithine carbamoyltransferase [Phycisphaerae bacterium]|nr:ornithine carbamoyltransferase [Phycisphaerae bacterium]